MIAAAARSVKDAKKLNELEFSQLKVDLEFGVDRQLSLGPSVTVNSLVVVSASAIGGYSDSTVQTITVTFKAPESKKPAGKPTG